MKKHKQRPVIHQLRNKHGSKTLTIQAEICKKHNFQAGDHFEITIITEDVLQLKKLPIQ